VAALALLLTGCASNAPSLNSGEVALGGLPVTPEHTLSPGDVFEIRFAFSPDLNDRVTVGVDGTVSPKFIGSVIVGGLSVPEATARLKPLYAKRLKDAELSLTVRLFAPEVFWVDGDVVRPGLIRSTTPLTLERGVTQAGGAKPGAATGDILVIRRDETGAVHAYQAALAPPPGGADPLLKSFDVVYVPKTAIGSVNDFLATYAKGLPFSTSLQINPAPATTITPQQIAPR
jgi:protein involved in polysaccharide export with SLBB domain